MAEKTLERPLTFLHRAFIAFQRVSPEPLTPRGLAALLRTEVSAAYGYIKRLKSHNVIRLAMPCNRRFPAYELVPGTGGPPADGRGRRNPKASRPISQFTDRPRRIHRIR